MATIKLSNGVKISADSVVHQTITIRGCNTGNVIASNVGRNTNYTATQDCYFRVYNAANTGWYIGIDGVEAIIYHYYDADLIPVKKGQVIKVRGGSDLSPLTTTVYGLK